MSQKNLLKHEEQKTTNQSKADYSKKKKKRHDKDIIKMGRGRMKG